MTTFGYKTDLQTVLDAIAAKPGTATGDELFPDERIFVTLAPDDNFDQNPSADSFLIISPKDFMARTGMIAGGGTGLTAWDGRCGIDLWNRFEVDNVLSDKEALHNSSHGILAVWDTVLTSLQLYAPLNDAGKCILIEPMRIVNWSVTPRRPKSPWLVIKSMWDVKFVQSLV